MGRALLLLASGLTVVFGIVQKTMLERQTGILPQRGSEYAYEQQARSLSNAMLDAVVQQLVLDNDWTPPGGGSVRYDQNSPSLPADHDAGDPSTWGPYQLLIVTQAIVDEEGTENEYVATTEATMIRDSFSRYSYFTNFEPVIWFVTGDVITGPVHTNGTFNMDGQPRFEGRVTSPNMYNSADGSTSPIFNGGSDFSSQVIPPPNSYDLELLSSAAASGGLQFNNPISIDLQYNQGSDTGSIQITEYDGGPPTIHTLTEAQYNGKIISSNDLVEVSGKLKGQLSIHSEDRIEIMGDIEYSKNPVTDSTSTDLLGLISEGDVRVDRYAHTASGSQDINIHASIMALNTSFEVEEYWNGSKGTINLLGGLIQEQRGPVGLTNGNGYLKNYQYDDRLLELVPPSFPRESVFSFGYWKDTVVLRETPN